MRTTTRATWRWCAARSRRSRSCLLQQRLRSSRRSTRGADVIGICICPSDSAARICRASRRSTYAAKHRRVGASSRRASPKPCGIRLRAANRRFCSSIAAVMRRSRYAAPGLPTAMPELRRLAGRSPFSQASRLPPLWLQPATAGRMSEVPRYRKLRRSRSRRRTAGAGSGRIISRGAHSRLVERSRGYGRATSRRA